MADGKEIRSGVPSGFMSCIRARDQVTIALDVLHALDTLEPTEVPTVAYMSQNLQTLMSGGPKTLPDVESAGSDRERAAIVALREEHEAYCASLLARAGAKAENQRRLRSTLWAEQCLRANAREEHEVLRAFNRDVWNVSESASRDIAIREAQVKAHA